MIKNMGIRVPRDHADKTTQVQVRKGVIADGHSSGTIFFCTPARAKQLHSLNAVDIIGDPTVPMKKDEVAAGDPDKGKLSGAPASGLSTGSASSTEQLGPENSSSVLAEGQASQPQQSTELQPPAARIDADASSSTTDTVSARGPTSTTSPTTDGGSGTAKGKNTRRS